MRTYFALLRSVPNFVYQIKCTICSEFDKFETFSGKKQLESSFAHPERSCKNTVETFLPKPRKIKLTVQENPNPCKKTTKRPLHTKREKLRLFWRSFFQGLKTFRPKYRIDKKSFPRQKIPFPHTYFAVLRKLANFFYQSSTEIAHVPRNKIE